MKVAGGGVRVAQKAAHARVRARARGQRRKYIEIAEETIAGERTAIPAQNTSIDQV
jgi:hypothetical protein